MEQRIRVGKSTSIAWDDAAAWHYVVVNGRVLNLSPTHYRICRAFLTASETKQPLMEGQFAILAYQSYGQLLDETHISRRRTLIKHISMLNTRLSALGLEFCSFQGGYLLCISANAIKKMRQET
jgi:hypothetical protein